MREWLLLLAVTLPMIALAQVSGSYYLFLFTICLALGIPLLDPLLGRAVLSCLDVTWLPGGHPLSERMKALAPEQWRGNIRLGVIKGSPDSFTVSTGLRSRAIILTDGLLDLLDERELSSVLAHEIAHATRGHGLMRTLAFAIGLLNVPAGTALGAALCRKLEYEADELAVRTTGQPLDLAAALVKVTLSQRNGGIRLPLGFAVPSRSLISRLFSWTPPLEERLRRIFRLACDYGSCPDVLLVLGRGSQRWGEGPVDGDDLR